MDSNLINRSVVDGVFMEKFGQNSKEQLRWDRHVVRRTMKEKLNATLVRVTFSGEDKDTMRVLVISEAFKTVSLIKRLHLIQDVFDKAEWEEGGVLRRRTMIMLPFTPEEYLNRHLKRADND